MPYGVDEQGRPIFLISTMAMHTKNLMADPRASLLVMQPDVTGDPLGAARVTVMGRVARVQKDEQEAVRATYLARYDNAGYWADFSDFGFYRMDILDVYYVGGFGVMGWVTADDYVQASVDPLADEAPRIIQMINAGQAAELLGLARAYGHAEAEEARMTAMDRLGFHLRLRAGDRVQGCRIAFPRPVQNARDTTSVFEDLIKQARGRG
jgi:putative heme iron utilization protein